MASLVGLANDTLAANPDGRDVGFRVVLNENARATNSQMDSVLVNVLHASPGESRLKVTVNHDEGLIVDSVRYGDYSEYVLVPVDSLDVVFFFVRDYPAGYESCYIAFWSEILAIDNVFTLVIPPFQEYFGQVIRAVFPNGRTLEFYQPIAESVATRGGSAATSRVAVYPNPVRSDGKLFVAMAQPSGISIEIVDILGRVVFRDEDASIGASTEVEIDLATEAYAAGVYSVRVIFTKDDSRETRTTTFVKL